MRTPEPPGPQGTRGARTRSPRKRIAAAEHDTGTIAFVLAGERARHGVDDTQLATWLRLSVEQLHALALERRPNPESPTLAADIAALAERYGANLRTLANLLLNVDETPWPTEDKLTAQRNEAIGAAVMEDIDRTIDRTISNSRASLDMLGMDTGRIMRELGLPTRKKKGRGRPPGPREGSDAAHWLARADAIGERAARAEYYAQVPRSSDRYDWWDDNVLRTLRRRKHRQ